MRTPEVDTSLRSGLHYGVRTPLIYRSKIRFTKVYDLRLRISWIVKNCQSAKSQLRTSLQRSRLEVGRAVVNAAGCKDGSGCTSGMLYIASLFLSHQQSVPSLLLFQMVAKSQSASKPWQLCNGQSCNCLQSTSQSNVPQRVKSWASISSLVRYCVVLLQPDINCVSSLHEHWVQCKLYLRKIIHRNGFIGNGASLTS